MNEALDSTEGLIEEIARYLAVVDAFRAADCEPTWRPELLREVSQPTSAVLSERLPSDLRLH